MENKLLVTRLSKQDATVLLKDYPHLQVVSSPDETLHPLPSRYEENGAFFEDFANGIPTEHWHLMRGRWGEGNNGVLPENASYTEDGVLVLRAYGDYYTGNFNEGRGIRSGAVLSSNRPYGPGRYEIRMKTTPQMGTCTAMWTYFNDGKRNHEIDIELPGGTKDFFYSLFTNWHRVKEDYISQHTIPAVPHNDGNWHTYRFDWHTEPARIDYYVDDKLELSETRYVPTVAGHFNVGVWFPKDWCGEPNFDTAYMLVDWMKYEPFDEPFERFERKSYHPTEPAPLPVTNFIANSDFAENAPAWNYTGDVARIDTDSQVVLKLSHQATATQRVASINPNAAYALRYTAMGHSAVTVTYLDIDGNAVGEQTFVADGAFAAWRQTLTTPDKTRSLQVMFASTEGDVYLGDVYLTQPSRGDFIEKF